MPEFKLMVSHNCGISYCFEMATEDRQDPELLKKIEEVSKKGLRFYIEGDDEYLCPAHEEILKSFHAAPKNFTENKSLEARVKELQDKFSSRKKA